MCAHGVQWVVNFRHIQYICDQIWEKGPYGAKTKLKLRLEIPLQVNPVQKRFF